MLSISLRQVKNLLIPTWDTGPSLLNHKVKHLQKLILGQQSSNPHFGTKTKPSQNRVINRKSLEILCDSGKFNCLKDPAHFLQHVALLAAAATAQQMCFTRLMNRTYVLWPLCHHTPHSLPLCTLGITSPLAGHLTMSVYYRDCLKLPSLHKEGYGLSSTFFSDGKLRFLSSAPPEAPISSPMAE